MIDIAMLLVQATPLGPADTVTDFSFFRLFLMADWVVKSVMLILVIASIWSWAIAVDKVITFVTLKRRAADFEETFWSGRTLDELNQGLATEARDPMARVFAAAMREWDESKTGTRSELMMHSTHERIDRVMNGIAEALFATALGLIAAIPAVIFYNKFSNDLDKYAARLEGYADELSAILSRKLGKGA